MANIKSFPNNQDEYIGAQEVMRWLHGRTSGVFGADSNAAVAPVPNAMAVTVSDGNGWLANEDGDGIAWWIDNEATSGNKLSLNVDMADAVLPRIDRVVVSWQTTDYVALPEVKILKGVPASNPVAPELTNNNIIRQISLAAINIPAGATAVTALMITDERLNPAVCGIVTESVKADTSMMNAQYRAAVEQLENAIAQAWDGEISDGSITAEKLAPDFIANVSQNYSIFVPSGSWKTITEAVAAWGTPPAVSQYGLVDFDYKGENSVYAMAIAVPDLKAIDMPIVDVDLAGCATASEAIAYRDAWGCVDRCVALDNWLVLYALETKPTNDTRIMLKVVR